MSRSRAIQAQLIAWARWCHIRHGADIGYPSQTPFRRLLGGGVSTPLVADDYAMRIDAAVAELKQRCGNGDLRWHAVTDSYLLGRTDSQIARQHGVGRGRVREARIAAENWIDARIN